uniref:Uncharacterized protein n=1 Tax=viral metagenome TaxID=1070528 RepID=A0A6C0CL06_9ZZZZ
MLNDLSNSLISSIHTELNKDENQEKMKECVIDPFTGYISGKLYPYILSLSIIMISQIILMIVILLLVIIKFKR